MPRIAMGVCYDGHHYHGWQKQANALATVQQALEAALSVVANHTVKVCCAGRTDAAVHATAQVLHFDSDSERLDQAWVLGGNANLAPDISIVWAKSVPVYFHARFSALARRYRYIFYNQAMRPGILRHGVTWWRRPLDEQRMHQAAQQLLGEHDFSAFRGAGCQSNTPMRCIQAIAVYRLRDMVVIDVQANAFLLHMVRNIAGVLAAIGSGDQSPQWALEVLESRDRRCAAATLSSAGLYLVQVQYPSCFALPVFAPGPFFLSPQSAL